MQSRFKRIIAPELQGLNTGQRPLQAILRKMDEVLLSLRGLWNVSGIWLTMGRGGEEKRKIGMGGEQIKKREKGGGDERR